jgi:hypothetical protein
MDDTSGSFDGLSTYDRFTGLEQQLENHVGAVVIRSRSYSRSRRSWMISMCSMPRKPQRKPKPRASELSGVLQRRVVQGQLCSVAEVFEVVGADREQAGVDLRLDAFEAGSIDVRGRAQGQGVTHRAP